MPPDNHNMRPTDAYGFPIDPTVGYARGKILGSSLDEARRRLYALRLIQERAAAHGTDSFYNLTGLQRDFGITADTIPFGNEWTGPAFFWIELEGLAREHLGGGTEHAVAVVNRCSAGIIATCLALARPGSTVVSVVPSERGHPSIARGVALSGAHLRQVNTEEQIKRALETETVSLVIVTGVSSELAVISEMILAAAVRRGRSAGVPIFLDDAYGTRLRPIIYNQPTTLGSGVDLGITSLDKAGGGGPRAGLMVGRADLMERVNAKATELGCEARTAIALAVWHSLKRFDPAELRHEVDFGKEIYAALVTRFGDERVRLGGLGASITVEDAYELVRSYRAGGDPLPVAPPEVTAAVGMYWLARYGLVSVNALGGPGASVWLRFKPDPAEIDRFGGIEALVDAVEDGLRHVAARSHSLDHMRDLILGEPRHDA